jgi:hypothetical protein
VLEVRVFCPPLLGPLRVLVQRFLCLA